MATNTNTHPTGATPTNKGKRQEPNLSKNYPSVSFTLTRTNQISTFDSDFTGYFDIVMELYHMIKPGFTRSMQESFTSSQWFEYCGYLLSMRLFDILVKRPFEATLEYLKPRGLIGPIPRPLYTYLSSLGDISGDESGYRFEMAITIDTCRAIEAYSRQFRTIDVPDTPKPFNHRETAISTFLRTCAASQGIQIDAKTFDDEVSYFEIMTALAPETTEAQCRATLDWIKGMVNDPPIRTLGSFNDSAAPAIAANMLNIPLMSFLRGSLVQMGFDARIAFPRIEVNLDLIPVFLRPQFQNVLHIIPSKYNCSNSLPTTVEGSRAQWAKPVEHRGYSIQSPVALGASYLATAYTCAFTREHQLVRLTPNNGWMTNEIYESPATVRTKWLASNLI